MSTAGDQERIAILRALLEAEAHSSPGGSGSPAAHGGDGPAVDRRPLFVAAGAGVAIAVVVALLIAASGGGGVEQPAGTTLRAVSVFQNRAIANIDKGDKVTICDRSEGTLAEDVTVADYGVEESQLLGRMVRLDLYLPNQVVGRFANKRAADLDVVKGRCGPPPAAPAPTTTAAPATQPPANPTEPTQPPDTRQPSTPPATE